MTLDELTPDELTPEHIRDAILSRRPIVLRFEKYNPADAELVSTIEGIKRELDLSAVDISGKNMVFSEINEPGVREIRAVLAN